MTRYIDTETGLAAALYRLAALPSAGTYPDRMVHEADKIIAEWQVEGLDADTLRKRLATLRDDLADGVTWAKESAGDVDSYDKNAVRKSKMILEGLVAAHGAVVRAVGA